MFWRVEFEHNGKSSVLYYGGKTTEREKNQRLEKLKVLGYKILDCYKVDRLT